MEVMLVAMLFMLVAALVETAERAVVNEVRLVPAALAAMLLMLLEIPVLLAWTASANEVAFAALVEIWAEAAAVMVPPWAVIAAVFEAIATDLTTCYIEFALMLIMFAETAIWRLPISVDWIWFD